MTRVTSFLFRNTSLRRDFLVAARWNIEISALNSRQTQLVTFGGQRSEDAIRPGEVQELREVVKNFERFTAFSPLFERFGWGQVQEW